MGMRPMSIAIIKLMIIMDMADDGSSKSLMINNSAHFDSM